MVTPKKSSNTKNEKVSDKIIGLLLVHGIGQQKPGDQLAKFSKGFQQAYPETKTISSSHDRTVLQVNGLQIRLIADAMSPYITT